MRPETPHSSSPSRTGAGGGPVLAVALLLGLVMSGVGMWLAMRGQGWAMISAGAASVVVTLVTQALLNALHDSREASRKATEATMQSMRERTEQLANLLNQISEQQLISDRAKAIAYREKDHEALRRAVREEMDRENWDAAMSLATDIGTSFGYVHESQQFRDEITRLRTEKTLRIVNERLAIIDEHIKSERWAEANAEASRLLVSYPDVEQLKNLPQELLNRREGVKKQLLDSWHDCLYRRDIDGSIGVLRRLDQYLTPAEAEDMEETVRGVFREKLNMLRADFGSAVHDQRWHDAVRIGETIVRDFPNARIAQEVRETMAQLRQRAIPGTPPETAPAEPPPATPAAS